MVGVALEFEVVDIGRTLVSRPLGHMVRLRVCRFGATVGAATVSHDQMQPLVDRGEAPATPQPEGPALAVAHMADDLRRLGIEMRQVGGGYGRAVEELGLARLGGHHDVHQVPHVAKTVGGPAAQHQLDERIDAALGGGADNSSTLAWSVASKS